LKLSSSRICGVALRRSTASSSLTRGARRERQGSLTEGNAATCGHRDPGEAANRYALVTALRIAAHSLPAGARCRCGASARWPGWLERLTSSEHRASTLTAAAYARTVVVQLPRRQDAVVDAQGAASRRTERRRGHRSRSAQWSTSRTYGLHVRDARGAKLKPKG